jgi:molybdopterin converting factor small subunit
MKLRVQYMGPLRTAAGRSEDDFDLSEAISVPSLLGQLAERLGDSAAGHLVTSAGQAQCGLLIVVNGTAIPLPQMAAVLLNPGDVVTLLPPIAGG